VDPEIEWIEVPVGSFTFGAPLGTPCMGEMMEKEVPVTLTRPFQMAKTELTQKQWAAMGFPAPKNLPECDDCPVTYIDWFEALAWCNALSRFEGLEECYDLSRCKGEIGGDCPEGTFGCGGLEPGDSFHCTGKTRKHDSMYDCAGYRLPTGPEWEYAAKAGTTTNTYAGDITVDSDGICVDEPILNDIAWYCFNSGADAAEPGDAVGWSPEFLHPVRQKQPNPFGLYDMLGNAAEWVDYVITGFSLDANEGKHDEALVDPMGTTEDDDERRDTRGYAYLAIGCYMHASFQGEEGTYAKGAANGFRPVRTLPATVQDASADCISWGWTTCCYDEEVDYMYCA
jgi:formylglycine-generating enzyme required for sulfatase activity